MYKTILTPRVSETDAVGHINNTTLPVWFEAGRKPVFDLFTPDHDFANWKMVIVKTTLEFTGQLYYGQDVEVNVWVKKIGGSSLELYEELRQNGNLCARNVAIYVNYNLDSRKSEKIPEGIRAELGKYLWKEQGEEMEIMSE